MKKRKGELPSGNVRRQVFVGYETRADGSKKRIYKSITAPTVKDAEALVNELKYKKTLGKPYNRLNISFKEAREKYLEDMEGILSPSTIRGYAQMRTYFPGLDDYALGEIDEEVLKDWLSMFMRGHSVKTVRNAYGLITRVLAEYKLAFKIALPKKEQKDVYVPSDEDIKILMDYFSEDGEMFKAICLGAFGGMRRSEIAALEAEDVSGNVIHIHAAMVIDKNKNFIKKPYTKNPTSNRFVDMPAWIVELLPSSGRLVDLSPDNITNRFCRGLRRCGLPLFRFHDLRHYSISIMHAIGVPDVYIQERNGFASDLTMKRVYRGSIESYKRQFADKTVSYFDSMQHVCNTEN